MENETSKIGYIQPPADLQEAGAKNPPKDGDLILWHLLHPTTGLPVVQIRLHNGEPVVEVFNREGNRVVDFGAFPEPQGAFGFFNLYDHAGETAVTLLAEDAGGSAHFHHPGSSGGRSIRVEIAAEEDGAALKLFSRAGAGGEAVYISSGPATGAVQVRNPEGGGTSAQMVAAASGVYLALHKDGKAVCDLGGMEL